MDFSDIVSILGILVGGGGFLGTLILLPKVKAERRKLEAETDKLKAEAKRLEWQTLHDEILRLNGAVARQDKRIKDLEKQDEARARRENELEAENASLRRRVDDLETKLQAMEHVFKRAFERAPDNTGEWNDLLRQVDEAEASLKDRRDKRPGKRST